MDLEIESLLFKQVEKPKNHLMTRITNVFDNRYRINVYIEIEEDNLIKKRIHSSYFTHYIKGSLKIIPDCDKDSGESLKKRA
jgi:3-polyprenyl-4-hydroxybenzoate decarboxylase